MSDGFALLKPLLHLLPPETVHALGLWALKEGLISGFPVASHPRLRVRALSLDFPNPVGLAAGFDKDAAAVVPLLEQGFGFVEAGTVTPLPQPGNPRPRVFRLPEDKAVINRLGFNGLGLAAFVENLEYRDWAKGIVGANIGKNKESADANADYVRGLETVYPHVDYVTVNISSPNTPGLRALQAREALEPLLAALMETRVSCRKTHGRKLPLLLKVSPDLGAEERRSVARLALDYAMDGLVIGNTTTFRPPSLRSYRAAEQGGLSGRPLFAPSTEALKDFYRLTEGKLTLIGVGGIFSAADAYAKIRAGATLVQLYTSLVYQGFSVVRKIQQGLVSLLEKDGFANVTEAVGVDAGSA